MNVPDLNRPDIAARTAAMTRHRRRIAQSRSTEEHLQIVERLQRDAMRAIRSDAIAYQAFMARNHHKRRREAVERLQTRLLGLPEPSSHE
ncbi:hypothetical protein [Neorhodopirellula pilleata]|uniref:Uncharacterized protein n=1 Tax=Neorhodopirellula pilleata TaxID=2714738 RepID=A0A5C6AKT2_9BACT|nr:hypothetical protein [Neorhodopirellula pilleata]TWT98793.1 hypothetical protein Pla100_19590 [Neorhodopirellula pilleata]